jgi:hypothetical protein
MSPGSMEPAPDTNSNGRDFALCRALLFEASASQLCSLHEPAGWASRISDNICQPRVGSCDEGLSTADENQAGDTKPTLALYGLLNEKRKLPGDVLCRSA